MNDNVALSVCESRGFDLFEKAFNQIRDPRSDSYMLGVLHALQFRIDSVPFPKHPYAPGSAESDAYCAGIDEGQSIWRKYSEQYENAT